MMSLVSFFFNGRSSSEFPWLVVNKISGSILPPQEQKLIEVPGRAGAYHAGKKVGVRKESITITVYGDSQEDLASKKRILADWLDTETPQTFYYSYEPDKEYKAILDGETDLGKVVTDGETTLVFIMPDPYADGVEKTVDLCYKRNVNLFTCAQVDSNADQKWDDLSFGSSASATYTWSIESGAQKLNVTSSTGTAAIYLAAYKQLNVTPNYKYRFMATLKTANLSANSNVKLVASYWNGTTWTHIGTAALSYSNFTTVIHETTAPADAIYAQFKVELALRNDLSSNNIGTYWFKDYKVDEILYYDDGEAITVTNNGNLPAFPVLHFEFVQPTTEFAIISSDRYLYFGKSADVDTYSSAPKRTRVLLDDCSSIASYTSGITIDGTGATIAGSFTSDGSVIKTFTYGSGSAWHGPAGVRSIGQTLTDFTVQADVNFKKGKPSQAGRLEIYLLDQNNAVIGKMAIRDTSVKVDNPYLEARAGALSGGKYFVNYVGKVGRWAQFTGQIRISRIGQKWTFTAIKRNSSGKIIDSFTYPFYDKNNSYSQSLAAIQIHFGQYGSQPFVTNLSIDKIEVWSENTYNPSTQVPYVFDAGDILDIDCSTGVILKNEEPFYTMLDPNFKFLKLEKGSNNVAITPQQIFNVGTLTFKERWR